MRNNPLTGSPQGYYRLVESYRNEYNRICHRTLLNIEFVDIGAEKLNAIKDILNNRALYRHMMFEQADSEVISLADKYWKELVEKRKVDVSDQSFEKQKRMVDVDTINPTCSKNGKLPTKGQFFGLISLIIWVKDIDKASNYGRGVNWKWFVVHRGVLILRISHP